MQILVQYQHLTPCKLQVTIRTRNTIYSARKLIIDDEPINCILMNCYWQSFRSFYSYSYTKFFLYNANNIYIKPSVNFWTICSNILTNHHYNINDIKSAIFNYIPCYLYTCYVTISNGSINTRTQYCDYIIDRLYFLVYCLLQYKHDWNIPNLFTKLEYNGEAIR